MNVECDARTTTMLASSTATASALRMTSPVIVSASPESFNIEIDILVMKPYGEI
jgi:hypothetical protein